MSSLTSPQFFVYKIQTMAMTALQGSLKWGFFGAGKITSDFVTVLNALSAQTPQPKHISLGVAARDFQKAKQFAESHKVKKSFQSYSHLVKDPEIDIVYIGTVNSEHYSQAKLAIEHSKHVLVEKPICTNFKQCQDLMESAKRNVVFLMEGFWTTAFPAAKQFYSEIKNGAVGEVVSVILDIGRGREFCKQERFQLKELSGGVLLNHGVYGLMLTYLMLGKPDKLTAIGHLSQPEGIDETVSITMSYGGDKACISNVFCTMKANMSSEMRVTGTKGEAKLVYPFWAPTKCESPNGTFSYELPNICDNVKFNYLFAQGFQYEIDEVYKCISQGLSESPLVPWHASLAVMSMADEVRKQIGVTLPQD